jgi:hypothetical protein
MIAMKSNHLKMRRRRSESNLKINQNRKTTGWTTLSVKI